jgi:hypothetical protein
VKSKKKNNEDDETGEKRWQKESQRVKVEK